MPTRFPLPHVLSVLFGTAIWIVAQSPTSGQTGSANWFDADLEPVWQAQVDAGRDSGGAEHVFMHVSDTQFTITHELIYNGKSTYFSHDTLDGFGKPIGEEAAAKAAEVALRTLKAEGHDAQLVSHRVPRIRLFVQTRFGILHVIDGETGEMLMTFSNGNPKFTSLAPAANDRYAAVVNGSTLYVLDLIEKKTEFEQSLSGAPATGPALSEEDVYVPLVGGIIESYRLQTKNSYRISTRFASRGNTHIRPMVGPDTVSWPSDTGLLYVVDTRLNQLRYRLKARSELVSPSTYLEPGRLLAASLEGYVFCFSETSGKLLWEYSTGEPLTQSAVGAQEQVFAVSEESNLFAINAKTGRELWTARGIKQVLSIGKDRIFCLGIGSIVVLDRETGGMLDTIPLQGSEKFLTNRYTDRIYLASRTGRLVCLRQQGQTWPVLHVGKSRLKPDRTGNPDSSSEVDGSEGPLTDGPAGQPAAAVAADQPDEDENADSNLFGDDTDGGDDSGLFSDDGMDDAGGLFGDDSGLFGDDGDGDGGDGGLFE